MPRWNDYQLSGNLTFFIREYVVTTILIVLILAGVAFALASEINIVAATIQVFGAALICVPLVSPKTGMYLLILAAGYLDLIKRLMVVTGQVGMTDITWVLAVGPVMFLATVLGVIVHRIFAHRLIERGEGVLVTVVAALTAVNVAIAFRDTAGTQTLQWVANTAGYIPLILLAGILFPTVDRLKGFLRYSSLALLPVPLYAIWQFYFGLTKFEYDYLRSGLTITEGSLDDLRPRPFSTLASPHPLTMVCAVLFLLSLIPVQRDRKSWFPFTNGRSLMIATTYLCGCWSSLARVGWLAAALGLVAIGCFGSRRLTKILYAVVGGSFVLMVLNAEWIEDHVNALQEMLPTGSDATDMALRLGTIGDRLIGWKNILSHPQEFGAFGVPFAERTEAVYVHDQIGQILLSSGYVGLLVVLSVVTIATIKAHTLTWKVKDPEARRLAVFCLAVIFAVLGSGAILGGSITIYPVNVLFWLSVGVIVHVLRLDRSQSDVTKKAGPSTTEAAQPWIASGSVGRRLAGAQGMTPNSKYSD